MTEDEMQNIIQNQDMEINRLNEKIKALEATIARLHKALDDAIVLK